MAQDTRLTYYIGKRRNSSGEEELSLAVLLVECKVFTSFTIAFIQRKHALNAFLLHVWHIRNSD